MTDQHGPIRQQNSVFFLSGPGEVPKPYADFYVRMFLEDISNGIVPYRSSRGRELHLEGGDDQSEALLAEAVDERGTAYGSFESGVSEFLSMAASEMSAFDHATYEIAYLLDPATRDTVGFLFVHIDNRQLAKRWGKLYQIVPPDIASERGVGTRIKLPFDDMLIFSLPQALAKEIRRFRLALTRLSDSRLGLTSLEMSQRFPNYTFKAHQETLNLALAQCSATVGWDARGSFRESASGYLTVYLRLKWELFKIQVRSVVFELFNVALDRVRSRLPLRGRIALENPPSTDGINQVIQELEGGNRSFLQILDRLSH